MRWSLIFETQIKIQLDPYLETDTIFIIFALYATRIELKWNNQDEIEV